MFSKSLNILALAVLFVIVQQSQTQSTTTEGSTTTGGITTEGSTTAGGITTEGTTTTPAITTVESTTTGGITTNGSTTAGGITTEGPTTTTTGAPSNICRTLSNCSVSDPPICGRLPTDVCRRFRNVCDLQGLNCASPNNPLETWTIVDMKACRGLVVGGTGLCARRARND